MKYTLALTFCLYGGVAMAQDSDLSGAWSVQGDQTSTNNSASQYDPLPRRIHAQWVITVRSQQISLCSRQLTDRNGMPVNPRDASCDPMEIRNVRFNGQELGFIADSQLEGDMYTEITTQYYVRLDSANRASGRMRESWDMAGNGLLPSQHIVTDYTLALTKMREQRRGYEEEFPTPREQPQGRQEGEQIPQPPRR